MLMLCAFAVQASPLVSLGDYGNIFFNGSFSSIWRSNVLFTDENEEEDFLFIVSPGLEMDFGSNVSNFDLNLSANYDIQRYDELTDFDQEYLRLKAASSYDAVRWSLNGTASYEERESTTGREGASIGDITADDNLILLDLTNANLNGRYQVSPKFGFNPGVGYSDRRYTNSDQLADNEAFSFPFDLSYQLTPKLDFIIGYRFTTNEIGNTVVQNNETGSVSNRDGHDQESQFFNIGANGKLLPKLNGSFRIGYTQVDPEDSNITIIDGITGAETDGRQERDSQSTLGLGGDLTYIVTPKLTSSIKLKRGFDVGSEGQTVLDSSARVNASYAISAKYFAGSFIGYTLREFEDGGNPGDDDIYEAGVNLSYIPDQYLRFSTGYSFIENDSERQNQGFVNHSVNLSVSFRY